MTSAKKHPSSNRQRLITLSLVVGTLAWVAISIIGSQLVVALTMLSICGRDQVDDPVFNATYSALSYIVALLLIVFVPMAIRHFFRRKSSERNKLSEQGESSLQSKSSKQSKSLVQSESAGQDLKESRRGHCVKEICDDLGIKGLPTWTDIGLAPVGYIAYVMLSMLFLMIFSLFPWFNSGEVQDLAFDISLTGADRVVAFLTLVVVAPIAEELIFRGWLYGKLRYDLLRNMSETGGMILAIFLTSLLFGAVHMQWNVGVDVFALSVILCGLREITGTTYSGILLHMIKNGLAFYMLFVLGV